MDESQWTQADFRKIDLESSDDDILDVQTEISLLSTCASPYITKYIASFLRGHKLWIVMEYLGGGSGLDLVCTVSIPPCRFILIPDSSNPGILTKLRLPSYAENCSSDSNTYTKKGRYTETSRLPMYCYRPVERLSWQTLGLLRNSPISNRKEIRLWGPPIGWRRKSSKRQGMITRRTSGRSESPLWNSSMGNHRMPECIL